MSDIYGFVVESADTIRLKTAGKYCDRDLYVTGFGNDGSGVTASEGDVLAGKKFVNSNGELKDGEMPIIQDASVSLSPSKAEYKIPKGYHSGNGSVGVSYDQFEVTPSKQIQVLTGSGSDTFIGQVTVNPIPDQYIVPSGTKEITENGTHDVTQYASVNVNVESGGGDLPSGYRRVDYIYFSGKQTIDTGIICNQNTKIQLAFTREQSTQHYMFGVASSGNTASVTAYMGGSWRFGNKSASKVPTTNANMIYSGLVDKSTVTITGGATAISGVNDFETVGSLLLGACRNSNGTVGASQFIGKILFFSMWEGDTQVQKLVPVTDGTVFRFYDMVSGEFFDSITDTPLDGGNL